MWETGCIEIPETGERYEYAAKVYDIGSRFGIDNGRISKLEIKKNGRWVFNYDRGHDINELGENGKKAYQLILDKYPNMEEE